MLDMMSAPLVSQITESDRQWGKNQFRQGIDKYVDSVNSFKECQSEVSKVTKSILKVLKEINDVLVIQTSLKRAYEKPLQPPTNTTAENKFPVK